MPKTFKCYTGESHHRFVQTHCSTQVWTRVQVHGLLQFPAGKDFSREELKGTVAPPEGESPRGLQSGGADKLASRRAPGIEAGAAWPERSPFIQQGWKWPPRSVALGGTSPGNDSRYLECHQDTNKSGRALQERGRGGGRNEDTGSRDFSFQDSGGPGSELSSGRARSGRRVYLPPGPRAPSQRARARPGHPTRAPLSPRGSGVRPSAASRPAPPHPSDPPTNGFWPGGLRPSPRPAPGAAAPSRPRGVIRPGTDVSGPGRGRRRRRDPPPRVQAAPRALPAPPLRARAQSPRRLPLPPPARPSPAAPPRSGPGPRPPRLARAAEFRAASVRAEPAAPRSSSLCRQRRATASLPVPPPSPRSPGARPHPSAPPPVPPSSLPLPVLPAAAAEPGPPAGLPGGRRRPHHELGGRLRRRSAPRGGERGHRAAPAAAAGGAALGPRAPALPAAAARAARVPRAPRGVRRAAGGGGPAAQGRGRAAAAAPATRRPGGVSGWRLRGRSEASAGGGGPRSGGGEGRPQGVRGRREPGGRAAGRRRPARDALGVQQPQQQQRRRRRGPACRAPAPAPPAHLQDLLPGLGAGEARGPPSRWRGLGPVRRVLARDGRPFSTTDSARLPQAPPRGWSGPAAWEAAAGCLPFQFCKAPEHVPVANTGFHLIYTPPHIWYCSYTFFRCFNNNAISICYLLLSGFRVVVRNKPISFFCNCVLRQIVSEYKLGWVMSKPKGQHPSLLQIVVTYSRWFDKRITLLQEK